MKNVLYLTMSLFLVLVYSCTKDVEGCMNPEAVNYNSDATTENNSCFFDSDGDGVYHTQEIFGCMDIYACDYDSNANTDDGSCDEYPEPGTDCQGNQIPEIGEEFLGGILFYIDESGIRGLIAAFEDIGSYEFGCYNEMYLGSVPYNSPGYWDDEAQIGAGFQNTMNIINYGCTTGWTADNGYIAGTYGGITAAQAAVNYQFGGYSDWYLPSRDELLEMYFNIGPGATNENYNIGGFSTSGATEKSKYWSSSLYNADEFSRYVHFSYGNDDNRLARYEEINVRPIRSF